MPRALLYRIFLPFITGLHILLISSVVQSQSLPSFRKTTAAGGNNIHYAATHLTAEEDILTAGYITDNSGSFKQSIISKYTKTGDLQWAQQPIIGEGFTVGGNASAITSIQSLVNGDIIAAGYVNTNKNSNIRYPYEDAFVLKLNAAGVLQWIKGYDRIKTECNRESLFRPFLITAGLNNEIIVAAEMFNCYTDDKTLVVMKLDLDGNIIWSSSYLYPITLSIRSGLSIEQSRISFWGTSPSPNSATKQNLDLLQFDYATGQMTRRLTWEMINNTNDPDNSLGGNILHSKRLSNGHILVYGATSKAFDNFTTRRANFSVLEFNAAYQFLNGYNIVPVYDPNSTINLNISADASGMVVFNRLFKQSVTEFAYALGTASNGQILHQRVFDNVNSNFSIPEPLQIFNDQTFAFINIYGAVTDFYKLKNADQNTGCLGNTNLPGPHFMTESVQYRSVATTLLPYYPDTIREQEALFVDNLLVIGEGNRLDLGVDQVICENNTVTLKAPGGFTNYLWNTGSTAMEISVQSAGIYYCTVTDKCGLVYSDTVAVKDVLSIELIKDEVVSVCKNEQLRLQAEPGFLAYRWGPEFNLLNSPGSQSLLLKTSVDTQYYVRATLTAGCILTDTVRVKVNSPPAFSHGQDQLICPQDSVLLRAPEFLDRVSWSSGSSDKNIWVSRKGEYIVSGITSEGCVVSDTIVISYKDCGNEFFMPNAFTPNRDGLNDVIRPILKGNLAQFSFIIYNRWGQVIYQTNDPLKGWDGRINGLDQAPQTYSWVCMYQLEGLGVNTKSGTISLLR